MFLISQNQPWMKVCSCLPWPVGYNTIIPVLDIFLSKPKTKFPVDAPFKMPVVNDCFFHHTDHTNLVPTSIWSTFLFVLIFRASVILVTSMYYFVWRFFFLNFIYLILFRNLLRILHRNAFCLTINNQSAVVAMVNNTRPHRHIGSLQYWWQFAALEGISVNEN